MFYNFYCNFLIFSNLCNYVFCFEKNDILTKSIREYYTAENKICTF